MSGLTTTWRGVPDSSAERIGRNDSGMSRSTVTRPARTASPAMPSPVSNVSGTSTPARRAWVAVRRSAVPSKPYSARTWASVDDASTFSARDPTSAIESSPCIASSSCVWTRRSQSSPSSLVRTPMRLRASNAIVQIVDDATGAIDVGDQVTMFPGASVNMVTTISSVQPIAARIGADRFASEQREADRQNVENPDSDAQRRKQIGRKHCCRDRAKTNVEGKRASVLRQERLSFFRAFLRRARAEAAPGHR